MILTPLWNTCDYLLQCNFGSFFLVCRVGDVLSRLECKLTDLSEKLELTIGHDINIESIKVLMKSSGVTNETFVPDNSTPEGTSRKCNNDRHGKRKHCFYGTRLFSKKIPKVTSANDKTKIKSAECVKSNAGLELEPKF